MSTKKLYDYIVCGGGPSASAFLRTALKKRPGAKVLLIERGPYCKTDILTDSNPFKVLLDSRRIIREYEHGVMSGSVLGGGTAVNKWVLARFDEVEVCLTKVRTPALTD